MSFDPVFAVRGVRLSAEAAERLRELDPERRERIIHVLREMVAVLEVMGPSSIEDTSMLQFNAGGVRVFYSITNETEMVIVHDVIERPLKQSA